jgi:hypothetical protein
MRFIPLNLHLEIFRMSPPVTRQHNQRPGRRKADKDLLAKIQSVKYNPIFVLGNHRSGTTILYKLLALTESFNIVNLYHTLQYDELLLHHQKGTSDLEREQLNRKLSALGIRNRIIDEMEVNADYPDEYCFVLITRKRTFQITNRSWPLFDEMCRKIQFISNPDRQLLLKNPFDYGNFMTVKKFVPETKFIFIHRHPVNVINSALNAVRTNWQKGNPLNELYSSFYTLLQRSWLFPRFMRWATSPNSRIQLGKRFIIRSLRRHENYFLHNIERLTPDQYVSVRYEDLIDDPDRIINLILNFLEIEAQVKRNYRRYIQPRDIRLFTEVKRQEQKIHQMFQDVLSYHGY